MGRTNPRSIFGIDKATFINRDTWVPYGQVRVLGSFNADLSREDTDLNGGSNPSPWESEAGNMNTSMSLTVREFADFLYELAGYSNTFNAAEAGGAVANITNINGTSMSNITNGISGIIVKTAKADNLKNGRYILKATAANTVDIYALSDTDFDNGVSIQYLDDTLKIATAISLATSYDYDDLGITINVTGTPAFVTGDTLSFDIRRANEGSYEYNLTQRAVPIECGLMVTSGKKGDSNFTQMFFPRVKIVSFPQGMTEKDFQPADLSIKVLYDAELGYTADFTDVLNV